MRALACFKARRSMAIKPLAISSGLCSSKLGSTTAQGSTGGHMPANVQTMAYYGDAPWHGLGTRVPRGITAEKMIRAAGMDWQVELRPARGADCINRKGEYSRYEVIRIPRPSTNEREVLLGVVSRRYQPLQNVDAFKFFDPIVGGPMFKQWLTTAMRLGMVSALACPEESQQKK